VLPVKPTKEQQQKITAHNVKFNTKKAKKEISNEFLAQMAKSHGSAKRGLA